MACTSFSDRLHAILDIWALRPHTLKQCQCGFDLSMSSVDVLRPRGCQAPRNPPNAGFARVRQGKEAGDDFIMNIWLLEESIEIFKCAIAFSCWYKQGANEMFMGLALSHVLEQRKQRRCGGRKAAASRHSEVQLSPTSSALRPSGSPSSISDFFRPLILIFNALLLHFFQISSNLLQWKVLQK
jgi:hypothetical protein